MGPLVGVLPLRIPTSAGSFRELAVRVAETTARALAHQDLPAGELARRVEVERPPGAGLTPVLLAVQPTGVPVTVRARARAARAHGRARRRRFGRRPGVPRAPDGIGAAAAARVRRGSLRCIRGRDAAPPVCPAARRRHRGAGSSLGGDLADGARRAGGADRDGDRRFAARGPGADRGARGAGAGPAHARGGRDHRTIGLVPVRRAGQLLRPGRPRPRGGGRAAGRRRGGVPAPRSPATGDAARHLARGRRVPPARPRPPGRAAARRRRDRRRPRRARGRPRARGGGRARRG